MKWSFVTLSTVVATRPARLHHCISEYDDNTTVCYPEWGIGMCEDLEKSPSHVKFDDEDALVHCEAMCSGNGVLPFLVGVNRRGMQKSFANKLCLGMNLQPDEPPVLQEHPTLVADCLNRIESVNQLTKELGAFIAAYDSISFETERYGKIVQNATAEVNAHIQRTLNEKFKDGLMGEKIKIIQDAKNDVLMDVMPQKKDRLKLLNGIKDVADLGDALITNLAKSVEKLENFQAECVQVTALRAGAKRAQIQDICATNSHYCFSTDDAHEVEHISCCCGGIPAIMTELQTAGTGMESQCYANKVKVDEEAVGDPRRLRKLDEADNKVDEEDLGRLRKLNEAPVATACTYATARLLEEGATVMKEMEALGLPTEGIEAKLSKLQEIHCADEVSPDRRLQQLEDVDAQVSKDDESEAVLHEKKCFSPPNQPAHADWPAGKHVLRVTDQAYDGQCADWGLEAMTQKCSEFCGTGNVPFVVGTTRFGFSHQEADELCLKLSGEMVDPDKVESCLRKASNMQVYKTAVVALEVELSTVKLELLKLTAMTTDAKTELMDFMRYEAPDLYKSREESELLEAYQAQLESLPAGQHRQARELKDAVGRAKDASDNLKITLGRLVGEAREFIEECDVMVTGWDSERHYMLDLCRVSGDRCLDEEDANRVTCCCGVMPLAKMAQELDLRATIPGHGDRRLSEETAESICEMVEEHMSQIREDILSDLEDGGHHELVQDHEQQRLQDLCKTTITTTDVSESSSTSQPDASWCCVGAGPDEEAPNTPKDEELESSDGAFQTSLLPVLAVPVLGLVMIA